MPSVSFITDFIQLIAYFLRFNITYFITKMSLDTPMTVNKCPSDIYVRNTSTTNCIHCFLHFQYFRITFFFSMAYPYVAWVFIDSLPVMDNTGQVAFAKI
jgi:hypothetical protein